MKVLMIFLTLYKHNLFALEIKRNSVLWTCLSYSLLSSLKYHFKKLSYWGPCQASNSYKQYCKKKIKWYCNILIKQYFFVKIWLLLFKISWNKQWIQISNSHNEKNYARKMYFYLFIAMSFCLFIAILLVKKSLVWREPKNYLIEALVRGAILTSNIGIKR